MDSGVNPVLFYFLAAVVILSASSIVFSRNLVHSALFMALCFIAVAGFYAVLDADFLAAVQIMIYAGTVVILIALGIMMTRRISIDRTTMPEKKYMVRSALLSGVLLAVLIYIFTGSGSSAGQNPAIPANTVSALAQLLLGHYMLVFEIAAVLLLAAMVGAVVLAKEADEK